jgi:cytochrome c556
VSPVSWMKKNQYSFFYNFKSTKEWYKYYPNGTEMSAEAKAAWEKMKSVKQEESKYILDSRRVENDLEQWMDELIVK